MTKDRFGNFVGTVKTYKDHKCYICNHTIPKGTITRVEKVFPGSATAQHCDIFRPLRAYFCKDHTRHS